MADVDHEEFSNLPVPVPVRGSGLEVPEAGLAAGESLELGAWDVRVLLED